MFDRLRKLLAGSGHAHPPMAAPTTPVMQWAVAAGFDIARKGQTQEFALSGQVAGKPFRLERAAPSRSYIEGSELRARAQLDIAPQVAVMVIDRPLRNVLEHMVYEHSTDRVRTELDTRMPEELRWLAMYDEVRWDSTALAAFWQRYAVVADVREHAQAWLGPALIQALLERPAPSGAPAAPFILYLQRGRLYLRMGFMPADLPTLQYAVQVLSRAAEAAQAGCAHATGT